MTASPATARLKPGQSLGVALSSRTRVTVLAGAVALDGPMAWLADTPLCPRTVLHAGQSHRPAPSGWVRVQALHGHDAVIYVAPTPGVFTRLWRWCRGRKKARAQAGRA